MSRTFDSSVAALTVAFAAVAASCSYDLASFTPTGTGAGGVGSSESSASAVVSTSTSAGGAGGSPSSQSSTSAVSSTGSGTTCVDDGVAVAMCAGAPGAISSDDFSDDSGYWATFGGAEIKSNHAEAQTSPGGPEAYFELSAPTPTDPSPSYQLHECWVAAKIDTSDAGAGLAFLRWIKDANTQIHFTVAEDETVKFGASTTYATKARKYLRVREHSHCLYVETADDDDSSWTEIGHLPTPAWLGVAMYRFQMGIANPDNDPSNKVVFDDYNLPPLP